MTHRVLLELRVQHAGPPVEACTGLEIRPDEAGARTLARHRLLARPRPDGIDVIGQVDAHHHPIVALPELTLSFVLAPRGGVPLRSELEPLRKLLHPTFHRPHSGHELRLARGAAAVPPGALARIEIAGVTATWLHKPHQYVISVPDRDLLRIFYLVCAPRGVAPHLLDSDSARALSALVDELSQNPQLVDGDPVGAQLVARHPGKAVYRLRIDGQKGLATLRGLSLRFGDHVVLHELPTPPLDQLTSLRVPGAKPRHAVYRVFET